MKHVSRGTRLLASAVLTLPSSALSAPQLVIDKLVTPAVATQGESVEFTVSVANDGDEPAIDVHVTDLLPAGLSIPAGMAAFTSQGTYDPATGDWMIFDVDPSEGVVMSLPAQVDADAPCLVNEAIIEPDAADRARGGSARAAVRRADIERCVDLEVRDLLLRVPEPFCSDTTSAEISLVIRNAGPDTARNVVFTLSDTPRRLPTLQFSGGACAGASASRCEFGDLAAGAVRVLTIFSGQFRNAAAYEVTLDVALTTTDVDYAPDNNRLSSVRTVPVTVVTDCPIPNPLGGGSGGCFIATAAYGQPWHRNVETLRKFRDRHLLTNVPGRAFVDWYYRVSPPLADWIGDKPAMRAGVRALLTPLVAAIRYPLAFALVAMLIASAGLIAWAGAGRRRVAATQRRC